MGKLYEEQLARQAAREEFLERTFNATRTDVIRNLLTPSDNVYEGKDTRNLDQYLIERQYDLSAIIAGSATVPDDIFKPPKNPDARAASKKRDEETVLSIVDNSPRYEVQTKHDQRPAIIENPISSDQKTPFALIGIGLIALFVFLALRGKI